MPSVEGKFTGQAGLELFYQRWLPAGTPRAAVAVIHGLGEHGGRYPRLVEALNARGLAVLACDHRGHGRSPGPRGHIDAWSDYREDTRAFVRQAQADFPGAPLFLYGHSLGNLIALDYLLHDPAPVRGAVISGCAFEAAGAGTPVTRLIAPIASRLAPRMALTNGLDVAAISRDPAEVSKYQADPLVHNQVTARFGAEAMQAVPRIKAEISRLQLPLLILHGQADRLCLPAGSQFLFDTVASKDKDLKLYPGGYHEPHNDTDSGQVLADVIAWLERRLA